MRPAHIFGLSGMFAALAALWGGCAASGENNFTSTSGNTGGTGTGAGTGGGAITLPDAGTGGQAPLPPPTAHLKGKVVAPEGTIPISGALVYIAQAPPAAIPDGVYCDQCVHLSETTRYTTTAPDGTFDLGADEGSGFLVVQKGAFRRVRPITVVKGDQNVPKALTTMPPKTDKANGDDVPKIAVVVGAWDPIELVLAKLGLEAKITTSPSIFGIPGHAQVTGADATGFAIYGIQNLGETSPHPDANALLNNPAEMEKYHMVFFPCTGGSNLGDPNGGPACSSPYYGSQPAKGVIDNFVKKGGRIYASDWSYEYVRQTFPGFLTWKNESSTIGSACQNGGGDQSAPPVDSGLDAWLKAQGQSFDTVKDAWTYISDVHAHPDTDANGKAVTETPKVWVHANSDPATTSFRHGCGRVLYTTYHTQPTNEVSAALEPQALALLYLILEVGVCIDTTGTSVPY